MKSLPPIVYNEDSKYVVGIQLMFQNAENVRFVKSQIKRKVVLNAISAKTKKLC